MLHNAVKISTVNTTTTSCDVITKLFLAYYNHAKSFVAM